MMLLMLFIALNGLVSVFLRVRLPFALYTIKAVMISWEMLASGTAESETLHIQG